MMKSIISHAIDWTSIKLNGICLLGFFAGPVIQWIAGIATLSTIVYNGIRIYKELKSKK